MTSKTDQNNKFPSVTLKNAGRESLLNEGEIPGKENIDRSKEEKNDKRVQLTKYFIAAALIITVGGMFAPNKVADDSYLVIVMFMVMAITMYSGFFALKNDNVSSLIFSLLSLYVWVAYPFKLMIALNYPASLWISEGLVDPNMVAEEIAGSFITVFPSLFCFLLGLFIFHRVRYKKSNYEIVKINHKTFIVVIILLICIKVFSQVVLNIAMPGVTPTVLPIPYLTGILSLISKHVLFAVVNLYFYYVIRLNDRKRVLTPLLFIMINVLLSLRVGYKGEMVIQGLLLIYYYFDAYRYLSKSTRKLIGVVTISMVMFAVIVYPLVNAYRHSILIGADFSEAVETAQKNSDSHGQDKSKFLSFIDRINGISEFYGVTKIGEGREFGFGAIFNDSVMDLAKEKLYGADKDKAKTAFSATYFSVFYLVGGDLLLVISGFIAGWAIIWSLMFIRYKVFKSSFTFYAYLPLVCILWVKVLASGGNLLLPMKELMLVVICLFLLEKYATTSK